MLKKKCDATWAILSNWSFYAMKKFSYFLFHCNAINRLMPYMKFCIGNIIQTDCHSTLCATVIPTNISMICLSDCYCIAAVNDSILIQLLAIYIVSVKLNRGYRLLALLPLRVAIKCLYVHLYCIYERALLCVRIVNVLDKRMSLQLLYFESVNRLFNVCLSYCVVHVI